MVETRVLSTHHSYGDELEQKINELNEHGYRIVGTAGDLIFMEREKTREKSPEIPTKHPLEWGWPTYPN